MAVGTKAQVSVKPETLRVLRARSAGCEICQQILGSIGEGSTLTEQSGISIEAQKKHIKAELAKSVTAPAASPASATPQEKEAPKPESKNGWPDCLRDTTVARLKTRAPKDEDSPGCFLCKWILFALGEGNKLRDCHPKDDQKQLVVKSQKMHLALEFGETEA